jgi:hypothetical protein
VARSLPAVHDLDSYLDQRVHRSQIEGYYEPNAQWVAARLRVIKWVQVSLAAVAAALAALAAVSATLAAWAAVASAAGAALIAHAAGERYEYLLIEYTRTAAELRRLTSQRSAPDGTPLSEAGLVEECEDVISIQNQAWMAKWGTSEDHTA